MLKIGEFSKLSMLTVKALRFYEKERLLSPACVDEYAAGDRASIEAGALSHLNTIAITLQRK